MYHVIFRSGKIFSFLLIAALVSCSFAQIDFPNFKSVSNLKLVGNAIQKDSILQLTDFTKTGEVGSAWYMTKQSLKNGFESSFEFMITPGSASHGDGFAFVIQNDSIKQDTALGQGGEYMGYSGLTNALAIEFDTFKNDAESDPDANHVGVMVHNTMFDEFITPNHSGALATVGDMDLPAIMVNADIHKVSVVYNGKTLTVTMDDQQIVNVDVDLAMILGDKNEAWVGFTGGTGNAMETHQILSWTFKQGNTSISNSSAKKLSRPGQIWVSAANQVYYSLPKAQYVTISLFDLQGRRVAVLDQNRRDQGIHSVNLSSLSLADGLYCLRLNGEKMNLSTQYLFIR